MHVRSSINSVKMSKQNMHLSMKLTSHYVKIYIFMNHVFIMKLVLSLPFNITSSRTKACQIFFKFYKF